MADTKKIVLEGDVTLAYFADEVEGKHVILRPESTGDGAMAGVPDSSPDGSGERLETKIANELNFPSDSEFDAIFQKLDTMRQEGARPAVNVPIGTREVKLRITIEVL
jgi:hypothetical protein